MTLLSRRRALQRAALAAPFVFTGQRAFAAEQITVADVGGAPGAAIRKAFYDPFEQATGIKVVGVVHESDPTVQFKLLVDSRSFIWDACMVTPAHVAFLTRPRDYLEPLNIAPAAATNLVPGMLTNNWLGFSVFSTMLAYRSDKFGENGPRSWRDFWDVAKFPGRRALYRGVNGTIEEALMADGVAAKDLYPLDVNRAFRKLDQIKPHINVWWTSGAQNTQLLQSGEVDMSDTWGARAFAAIDAGAPVKMVWTEGLYNTDGWSIPKGTPRADLARKFIEFCIKPELQAVYCGLVANGPSNTRTFEHLSPQRAAVLPTSAENIKGLAPVDSVWWAANRVRTVERFQDWLIG
jgi:putative spermidine/putrescine transport system substrate-binding protein